MLNTRLEGREYVADEYSIADMALFGWVRNWQNRDVDGAEFPNVVAWSNRLDARPAVQRGLAVKPAEAPAPMTEEQRKILYSQR